MNDPFPNRSYLTTVGQQCSKKRALIAVLSVILLLLITGLILIIIASLKPCLFLKCHPKASKCINRSLFKGQCICESFTAGNGRTVCDECGIKYTPPNARIIGGTDAIPHSWPFAVLIRQRYKGFVTSNGSSYLIAVSWMCGGTLINHKTILTAAHCLRRAGDRIDYGEFSFPIVWNQYYPTIESTLEVNVGVYDRRKVTEQRTVKVLQVILHPSYDNENLLNDIAIIKLEDYIRPSPTIQFACLPTLSSDVNITGTVVGFGDTYPGANKGSFILKQVNLTIYPNDYCDDVSPSTLKNWNAQICCGDLNGERDACQGDSGGGLFVQQNLTQTFPYTLDGMVSYGEECASPMKPGIYTRVSYYRDWIEENSDFHVNED